VKLHQKKRSKERNCSLVILSLLIVMQSDAQRVMESLDRGLIAIKQDNSVYIGWRLLVNDPDNIGFNVYRVTNGKSIKLNDKLLVTSTNYIDKGFDPSQTNAWVVTAFNAGKESNISEPFILAPATPVQQYLSVPLQIPNGGEVMGSKYTYSANDASVADLDGDGEYEIILKWEPSNAKNPPQTGFTGNQLIDAYKLNGKLLWRIDLGKNIRSGAAYTQFMWQRKNNRRQFQRLAALRRSHWKYVWKSGRRTRIYFCF
jgi:rhamnogalacturonan endolyase